MTDRIERRVGEVATGLAMYSTDGIEQWRNADFGILMARARSVAKLELGVDALVRELSSLAGAIDQSAIRQWMEEEREHSIHVGDIRAAGTLRLSDTANPLVLILISLHCARDYRSVRSLGAVEKLMSLSPREQQVALLLAEGCSNRDTAKQLGVSEHTARRHTERVLRQLGLTSRQQIAPLLLKRA